MLTVLVWSLLACHKTPVAEEVPVPEPVVEVVPEAEVPSVEDDWSGTPLQFEMYRAFSHRDASPDCDVVTAESADPVADLAFIVDNIPLPPAAGMRAADCIIHANAEAGVDVLVRWSTDPNAAGLARLIFGQLDVLPPQVSATVREAALGGPHADLVPDAG